jgi:type I restriction-modification system DNA methylase subunit
MTQSLFSHYITAENRINLYSLFIEQGFSLLKTGGYMSYINPNSMLFNSSYVKLRKLLFENIFKIVKLPDNTFSEAEVETIIFVLQK